jgi:hypothetical protein
MSLVAARTGRVQKFLAYKIDRTCGLAAAHRTSFGAAND